MILLMRLHPAHYALSIAYRTKWNPMHSPDNPCLRFGDTPAGVYSGDHKYEYSGPRSHTNCNLTGDGIAVGHNPEAPNY